MAKAPKLTAMQKEFARQYLLLRNGTKAAIAAGYSEETAQVQASRLLTNVMVREIIQSGEKRVEQKFEISHDRIVQEIAAIAFFNIKEMMDPFARGMALKNWDEIPETVTKAVSGVTESSNSLGGSQGFTTHSKIKALELLGRHVGMWRDKDDDAGSKSDQETRADVLKRVHELHRKYRERNRGGTGTDP